jgi:hypothetical protein
MGRAARSAGESKLAQQLADCTHDQISRRFSTLDEGSKRASGVLRDRLAADGPVRGDVSG